MRVGGVVCVVSGIVKTQHKISLNAVRVIDEEIGDAGSIGDEVGADAFCLEVPLAVGVRAGAVAGDSSIADHTGGVG